MTSGRRILFGPLPPPFGGVSTFMTALSPSAVERGVTVWTYTGKAKYRGSKNPVYLNHRFLSHIRALLMTGFRARITDSTHFHLEYPNIVGLPLWLAAKFALRFRWVKILHDGSLPERYQSFSAIQRLLFRLAVRNIDELIIYDPKLEHWMSETIGFAGTISSISIFLPFTESWNENNISARFQDSLDRFRQRAKRVLTVGFFIPSYGFLQVVEAVESLRQSTNEDIGLLIVAGGGVKDERFEAEVLTGRDWIDVMIGVPNAELAVVYRESDVFVRGFAHESFGLSRLEAMTCSTPVVATNVGETRGMLVYEFGDIGGLARQIQAVFEGKSAVDAQMWTDKFQKDASDNLAAYLKAIIGEPRLTDVGK